MNDWVFLRGLARDSRHWDDFPALFADRVPGARVIPLDLPGNGTLNDRRTPGSVEAIAAWCRVRARQRGVVLPCRVLGLSLGAMVAVAWAVAHPDEVAGAVLINTSLGRHSPPHHRIRPGGVVALLGAALHRSPAAREARVLRLTSTKGDATGSLAERWADYGRDKPVSRGNALRQLIAAARYRAPADPPPVPLLVLAGARDALVNPECSRRLAGVWACAHAEHPRAGHDLPLDDPAWVADQVRAWLAGR